MKERREATHRARAAAWEAEKAEAQANKVRLSDTRFPAAVLFVALPSSDRCRTLMCFFCAWETQHGENKFLGIVSCHLTDHN